MCALKQILYKYVFYDTLSVGALKLSLLFKVCHDTKVGKHCTMQPQNLVTTVSFFFSTECFIPVLVLVTHV